MSSRQLPPIPGKSTPGGTPARVSRSRTFESQRNVSAKKKTNAEDRKYPEIKQRGYYSDLITADAEERVGTVLNGPQTEQNTLWNVAKEQHTPQVNTFLLDEEKLQEQQRQGSAGPSTRVTDISVG